MPEDPKRLFASSLRSVPKEQRDVWDAKDVAEYLGFTDRFVTNQAHAGTIPGKQFGSGWRFSRKTIMELV